MPGRRRAQIASATPPRSLIVSELHAGRYVESTTALVGATTRIHVPFPVGIDPAGPTRQ
ncbi:hypothetical protein [Streptomyces mirabilis]|uniref:hypothetical protein n=1 Tax=Streptomyces mirabilis TaxID=68239 RepID=UPI0036A823B8